MFGSLVEEFGKYNRMILKYHQILFQGIDDAPFTPDNPSY